MHGDAGNDRLLGVGVSIDTMFGDAGNDQLFAGGGNDNLNGGDGADTLIGDAGNDTLNGGNGNDILRGGGGTATVGEVDTFVFDNLDSPLATTDRVIDFDDGIDKADFSAYGFGAGDEAALLATRRNGTSAVQVHLRR